MDYQAGMQEKNGIGTAPARRGVGRAFSFLLTTHARNLKRRGYPIKQLCSPDSAV